MNKSWFGKKRVDASDLAEMLSDALNQAFQRNLPDPQEISESIAKAIENANFSTADHMGKVKAEYQEAQNALLERWDAVIKELQANREAMADLPGNLQSVLSAETDRWKGAVTDFGARMDEVPVKLAAVLDEQGQKTGEMLQQMAHTFADQVALIKSTTEKLGDQLAKIGELTAGIDQVLRLQETVDGTMRQVTASQEMGQLLRNVQEHLQETNKFLQEAAKPRVVRLVESDSN
ncbi:MAG: hypothetical protein PHP44_04215 [Kiritimatiellae bacterium]|nr:hypothetical protein [Kiritimatiellia bacterium]